MPNFALKLKADRRLEFIIGFGLLGLISILVWQGLASRKKAPTETKPCYKKTITLWTPFEKKHFSGLAEPLRAYCLTLKIETKSEAEIRRQLLRAVVAGTGPTIAYIDADFLVGNSDIFAAVPAKLQAGFTSSTYPQAITEIFEALQSSAPTQKSRPAKKPESNFAAYPFTYDTLVLFWNKDLLQAIGETAAPATFEEIQALIPRLRRVDANNQITLSPIALGGAANYQTFFETFLSIWRMHNPRLPTVQTEIGRSLFTSLDFYTQFVNSQSNSFSWPANWPEARETFVREKTAMLIDFYSFKQEILKKNPRLNFAVGALPRFATNPKKTNYLQPYFLAVAKAEPEIGWLFLALVDKRYPALISKLNLNPIKIDTKETTDVNSLAEKQILFNELIVGDSFIRVDKEFMRAALKTDIENWLINKHDVQQLILTRQASKFFRKQ